MTMRTINITPEAAEAALLGLSQHVPRDVDLGRPLLAIVLDDADVQFLTDAASTWTFEGGLMAARMVALSDGLVEITRWMDGLEMARHIGRPGRTM